MNKYILPIVFGLLGYIFSSRKWIIFLNQLDPIKGLFIYYCVLISTLLILQYIGLVIANIEYTSFRYTIGSILIIFSFFIIFNWENCYIDLVLKGSCKDVSNVYLQAEDGAVFYLWTNVLGYNDKILENLNILRIMTYIITPLFLSFIGSLLITEKVSINIF